MRMAVAQPEKVEAIIIQNAFPRRRIVSLWAARRGFWQDRRRMRLRSGKVFSVGVNPQPALGTRHILKRIDSRTWTDEFYFLNQPGQADIKRICS